MDFRAVSGGILISDNTYFSAPKTLECGQVFRYNKLSDNEWRVISGDKSAVIRRDGRQSFIECADVDYFTNYFDLKTDYGAIEAAVSERGGGAEFLRRAVEYGRGIRILKQDFFETVISFIISANNNIKRIRGIIGRICDALGEETGAGYRAFPSAGVLASRDAAFYAGLGAGYRAPYITKTAGILSGAVKGPGGGKGAELSARDFAGADAFKKLLGLPGVGPKVANCILLFALNRTDACPVDTWIAGCYNEYFERGATDRNYICRRFTERFGDLSGYVQQFLFYFRRENP